MQQQQLLSQLVRWEAQCSSQSPRRHPHPLLLHACSRRSSSCGRLLAHRRHHHLCLVGSHSSVPGQALGQRQLPRLPLLHRRLARSWALAARGQPRRPHLPQLPAQSGPARRPPRPFPEVSARLYSLYIVHAGLLSVQGGHGPSLLPAFSWLVVMCQQQGCETQLGVAACLQVSAPAARPHPSRATSGGSCTLRRCRLHRSAAACGRRVPCPRTPRSSSTWMPWTRSLPRPWPLAPGTPVATCRRRRPWLAATAGWCRLGPAMVSPPRPASVTAACQAGSCRGGTAAAQWQWQQLQLRGAALCASLSPGAGLSTLRSC